MRLWREGLLRTCPVQIMMRLWREGWIRLRQVQIVRLMRLRCAVPEVRRRDTGRESSRRGAQPDCAGVLRRRRRRRLVRPRRRPGRSSKRRRRAKCSRRRNRGERGDSPEGRKGRGRRHQMGLRSAKGPKATRHQLDVVFILLSGSGVFLGARRELGARWETGACRETGATLCRGLLVCLARSRLPADGD